MSTGFYRFIGENGSMGLETGAVYVLQIYTNNKKGGIRVEIPLAQFYCPYDNYTKFRENWEPVNESIIP